MKFYNFCLSTKKFLTGFVKTLNWKVVVLQMWSSYTKGAICFLLKNVSVINFFNYLLQIFKTSCLVPFSKLKLKAWRTQSEYNLRKVWWRGKVWGQDMEPHGPQEAAAARAPGTTTNHVGFVWIIPKNIGGVYIY